jgi:hypothetical protein
MLTVQIWPESQNENQTNHAILEVFGEQVDLNIATPQQTHSAIAITSQAPVQTAAAPQL